jgi:hypothetical protein
MHLGRRSWWQECVAEENSSHYGSQEAEKREWNMEAAFSFSPFSPIQTITHRLVLPTFKVVLSLSNTPVWKCPLRLSPSCSHSSLTY